MKYFPGLIPLKLLPFKMTKREESLACILLLKYKTNTMRRILPNEFPNYRKILGKQTLKFFNFSRYNYFY